MAKDIKKPAAPTVPPTEPKAAPVEQPKPEDSTDWNPKSSEQWRKYVVGPGRK